MTRHNKGKCDYNMQTQAAIVARTNIQQQKHSPNMGPNMTGIHQGEQKWVGNDIIGKYGYTVWVHTERTER